MDARSYATQCGTRAMFERTAHMMPVLHRLESVVVVGPDGIEPRRWDTRHCKGETGNPTMSAALFKAEVAVRIYADAVARHSELIAWKRDVLHLLDGIAAALGGHYAECLKLHYIDGRDWREIAKGMGCTPRHARRMAGAACDWVDTVGWARACAGQGVAS